MEQSLRDNKSTWRSYVGYDGPNGSFFYFDTNSQFRIPGSEFRISKKKVVYGNFVFGDATSGSMHGVGQDIQNWNNSNNIIV